MSENEWWNKKKEVCTECENELGHWKKKQKRKKAACICFSFKPQRRRECLEARVHAHTHTRTHTQTGSTLISRKRQWKRRGTMKECREREEQSPYLGRPSSGVPDLEGRQEHSQQRVKGSWESSSAANTQASSQSDARCCSGGGRGGRKGGGRGGGYTDKGLAKWALGRPQQVAMRHLPLTSHLLEM